MLIDTHSHINMMIKKEFDRLCSPEELTRVQPILDEARAHNVTRIINVGTSLPESKNCITLAQQYSNIWAAVGIHPNDCTTTWRTDFQEITLLARKYDTHKIVAIGECGLDRHYPDHNLQRQKDAFKAHIELALELDLALIVHTRDAREETMRSLEEFKGQLKRGVIHCFSEDQSFADFAQACNLVIGIGGTITYPNNHLLRSVATAVPLDAIILETDAPFLPPQPMRGKQNSPAQIRTVADYLAALRGMPAQEVYATTTQTAQRVFNLP